ncbi:MAG TPA: sigma-54-dependent Fis family transcriptional regulator [Negativicutes bacterium]|nr:sigma-54-dependent Fis family transcriptional regulator [Negativicutes bacterium]
MTATNDFRDAVVPAWQDFVTGKKRQQPIRPQIVDSWTRCAQAGVNPYDSTIHSRLADDAMQALLADKQELIKIAKPFMANLYKFVEGSGFVVVLTDERGYIMEMFADEDILRNPMTNNFFRGASWREEEAGTNAIGTALVLAEPIQVSGAEHYCQKHHCLTCSSAPIFDADGRMIGILDMSGASYASHLHTLGMVVAAAEAINAQLAIRQKNRELALTNNRLTNIFNTMSDGVLMIDERGVVNQVNPSAKKILDKSERELIGITVDRVFGGNAALSRRMLTTGESYEDVELIIDTKKGMCHCFASGEAVTGGQDNVIGGVIILRPIKQIQNLVNRFSGYHATLQFGDIVGESVEILEAIRMAKLAATTSANILLQGESGTGKEIFAQAIHNRSEQRNGPFVALNCGVIPRELIGSELFGYVEGAFTGAKRGGKSGKFELASGGTLFLDEISDMPLEQQIALLRVLQEKKVTRIGGDKVIPVNVRIICATNRNLLQEVEKGAFRQDLYYRLNVISITIPPLRNRVKDIPPIFRHFLDIIGRDRGGKYCVEPEVMASLQNYGWPGNVRELQNVVERAVSLAENGVITPAHLPAEIYGLPEVAPAQLYLGSRLAGLDREQRRQMAGETERQRILLLLSSSGGNVSMVARELGISRNTLYRKMRQYAIDN